MSFCLLQKKPNNETGLSVPQCASFGLFGRLTKPLSKASKKWFGQLWPLNVCWMEKKACRVKPVYKNSLGYLYMPLTYPDEVNWNQCRCKYVKFLSWHSPECQYTKPEIDSSVSIAYKLCFKLWTNLKEMPWREIRSPVCWICNSEDVFKFHHFRFSCQTGEHRVLFC